MSLLIVNLEIPLAGSAVVEIQYRPVGVETKNNTYTKERAWKKPKTYMYIHVPVCTCAF
jgi:hypothetical protein